MKCPVCRAVYRSSTGICRRCGVDLSPLICLWDRAIWHHRQALLQLQAGNLAMAKACNDQALALHRKNADFYVLAGRLLALEGDFLAASRCWKQAIAIDSRHPLAGQYLAFLQSKPQNL